MSQSLPTGTVTFLFTDIEGSTKLLYELGERYADALLEHRRVLREAFRSQGGVEVDTQGDALFYAFPSAKGAVEAAAEAQQALLTGPISVRIGIHTGEPIVTDEGYVGLDVHRAARIMGAGHGGQVLVSQTTRELLDAEVALRDLGEFRLKDLSAPQRLYQLGGSEFPRLKTLYQTNLPIQPTPLVGRERELADVRALILEHRVVTLTGAGGSGKTRLSLHVAADAAEDFPEGVFWVPLQAVRDAALVLPAIAQTLGAGEGVASFVGDKRLLLVLDNLEQVLDASQDLGEVIASTRNAHILATSREPLRLAGEQRYAVEPLEPPAAVKLFVERARAVDLSFEPGEAVDEICRRLDGLPLAIELAAARVSLLAPAQLLPRLERALPVLTGGTRDAPERQRTLRATIDWSYELLDELERELFGRLGVFAGSFTVDAAEQVAAADLELLQSLVDKSLLRRWGSGRLGMLAAVQEFAEERLQGSAGGEETARRHAEFFHELAESANLTADDDGGEDHEIVREEEHNFRVALDWALRHDPVLGLQLGVSLEAYWNTHPLEGMQRLNALLDASPDAPARLRARGLRAIGGCANPLGEGALAEACYQESLEIFRELGDDRAAGHLLMRLGHAALYREDWQEARELAATSLSMSREAGDRQTEAQALSLAGEAEYALGDESVGIELVEQSVALAGEIRFTWWRSRMLRRLADWALERNDWGAAAHAVEDSLRITHDLDERIATVYGLARLARIAAETGEPERAGRLWGAIEAEEERGPLGAWRDERDRFSAPVLAHANSDFERGRESGRRLTLDDAVAEALRHRR